MRQGSTTVALHWFQRRSPGTADLVHGCIFSNHGIIPHPVMTTTLFHTCSLCLLPLWLHLTPVLSHLCQPRGLCVADTFLPFLGVGGVCTVPRNCSRYPVSQIVLCGCPRHPGMGVLFGLVPFPSLRPRDNSKQRSLLTNVVMSGVPSGSQW